VGSDGTNKNTNHENNYRNSWGTGINLCCCASDFGTDYSEDRGVSLRRGGKA
jgi:hypothetical protein